MGKFAILLVLALAWFTPQPAFAQKRSEICTSKGCKCYETWSDYWDQTYASCMAEAKREASQGKNNQSYNEMNDACGAYANAQKQKRSLELGVMADSLTQFQEVPCGANSPESPAATLSTDPDQKGHVKPPACIAEVAAAARACRDAQKAATSSCEPANNQALTDADAEGKRVQSSLSSQENVNNNCSETSAYQTTIRSALKNYADACEAGRTSCNTSCESAQRAAQNCRNAATTAPTAEIQEDIATCSEGGPLATKAQQATEQRQGHAQTKADADSCQTVSAAGTNPNNGGGPLTQTAGATSSGSLNGGATSLDRGNNPVATAQNTSRNGTDGAGSRHGASGDLAFNFNTAGSLKPNVGSGAGTGGVDGLGQGGMPMTAGGVSALPTRQIASTDSNAAGVASASAAPTAVSAGFMAGGGGARMYRAPMTQAEKDFLTNDPEKAREAGLAWPDLNAFRPQMGGMKAANFDGHGKHANLFEKIHQRYEQIENTLIRDAEIAP